MVRTILGVIVLLLFISQLFAQSKPHYEHELIFRDSLFYFNIQSQVRKYPLELWGEVYGFVPYWNRTYNSPRWDLVTRIAYFGISLDGAGNITATHYWSSAPVVDSAQAHGVPVDLCVTMFNDASIDQMLASATYRGNAIRNSISQMLARNGSGINLDLEFPSSSSASNLVTFCREMRDSLDAYALDLWLSICLPAIEYPDKFWTDQLALYCNAFFIMGYSYFWSGSSTTGPVCPLNDPALTYDLAYSVDHYVTESGTPRKIILGLPLYGIDWPCDGPSRGASTTGTGSSVIYSTSKTNAITYGRLWDANASSPWYRYGSWHQCWYSDSMSLSMDMEYAREERIMGVGFWALGYDAGDMAFWDAVEYEMTQPIGVDTSETLIVDNGDIGYGEYGTWTSGTYSGGWQNDYRYCNATGNPDSAYWQTYLVPGQYDLYMWWLAGSNRCSSVRVYVYAETTETVIVNQQGTGSTWHYLGRFTFSDFARVVITDVASSGGSVVIADAVKWVYCPPMHLSEKYPPENNLIFNVSPNPFNQYCKISISGLSGKLFIYDISGREIANHEVDEKGNEFIFSPKHSGLYLITFKSQNFSTIKRVTFAP